MALNSDVALECDVLAAIPPPQIRWLQDGNNSITDSEVISDNEVLIIYCLSLIICFFALNVGIMIN